MRELLVSAVATVAALILVMLVVIAWPSSQSTDSTDPPGGRSGLTLYVDQQTGCEYLSHRSGLTPRVDGRGRHLGCR